MDEPNERTESDRRRVTQTGVMVSSTASVSEMNQNVERGMPDVRSGALSGNPVWQPRSDPWTVLEVALPLVVFY